MGFVEAVNDAEDFISRILREDGVKDNARHEVGHFSAHIDDLTFSPVVAKDAGLVEGFLLEVANWPPPDEGAQHFPMGPVLVAFCSRKETVAETLFGSAKKGLAREYFCVPLKNLAGQVRMIKEMEADWAQADATHVAVLPGL